MANAPNSPAPPSAAPVLAVIVDTEEECDWSRPFSRSAVRVGSVGKQLLMHQVFGRHGIVPTYVVDWPVATTPSAIKVLGGLARDGRCEIGAHLHPRVSPPHTEDLSARHSYPGNLPRQLEYDKLAALTEAIERNFGIRPVVYKAGRHGFGPSTPEVLQALGYQVDVSVVPHTSFAADGGPDFRRFSDRPSWFGAAETLLELPLTVGFAGRLAPRGDDLFPRLERPWARRLRVGGMAARLGLLERLRLTPEGNDLAAMKRLTRAMLAQGHRVFTFRYHSPSLGIGHTPYVRTEDDLRAFLSACEGYFEFFAGEVGGRFATVTAIRDELAAAAGRAVMAA